MHLKIGCKGTVKLPFDKGSIIKACNSPEFSANIISVRFLLKTSKVEFSENEKGIAFYCVHQKESNILFAKIQKNLIVPLEIEEITKIN